MGYGDTQIAELAQTINNSPAEVVLIGTPIDLRRVMQIEKPAVRVRYDLEEIGGSKLAGLILKKL